MGVPQRLGRVWLRAPPHRVAVSARQRVCCRRCVSAQVPMLPPAHVHLLLVCLYGHACVCLWPLYRCLWPCLCASMAVLVPASTRVLSLPPLSPVLFLPLARPFYATTAHVHARTCTLARTRALAACMRTPTASSYTETVVSALSGAAPLHRERARASVGPGAQGQ